MATLTPSSSASVSSCARSETPAVPAWVTISGALIALASSRTRRRLARSGPRSSARYASTCWFNSRSRYTTAFRSPAWRRASSGLGTSSAVSCVLTASTLVTPSTSARASAAENVKPAMAVDGTPTRQPNQILSSGAPARIVPRLAPFGRCEIDGTCGGACPATSAASRHVNAGRPRRAGGASSHRHSPILPRAGVRPRSLRRALPGARRRSSPEPTPAPPPCGVLAKNATSWRPPAS